ncbi:molybdopterin-synthase adenylyltransferase MoeB [Planctomycetales bacterium ZRK34]|nr:molybdopterin-synthase adenylyltransferase MoeB [Planctomycetales bacterium ZRK34]
MPVTVNIPTALRSYADGLDTLELEGSTVSQVLGELAEKHPKLKPHLFGDDGSLRSFVNVFVNEDNIRDKQAGDTAVSSGDEVSIVPAVAGGNPEDVARPVIKPDFTDKAKSVEMSKEEIERYSRHLILPEVGMEGQKKLKSASILLIGTGGLGAPLGMYLAAAGIGRLGLVDFDVVDHSNLQRQVIHGTASVGKPKIKSAEARIKDINPNVQVDLYEEPFTSANAMRIAEPYDIIIDGTDNFPTRYLANDVSVLQGKPNVYGAIFRFDGQATVFNYDGGPCYRCLYPEPPEPGLVPSCAEGGVLGILPGIIGLVQATEAIKIILGEGKSLSQRLMMFDALSMKFREMKIRRDPACPICGDKPTITELIDYNQFCGVPEQSFEKDVQKESEMAKQSEWDISVADLKKLKDSGETFELIDVREPHEYDICHLDGKLIPLGTLGAHIDDFDKDAHIVVHCRSGGRSAKAVNAMRKAGFKNVWNVNGGILRWADEIDQSVPKY